MMRKACEIMSNDFIIVDGFWGMRRIQDLAQTTGLESFPVACTGKIVGVVNRNDLIRSHPNRIALDAMSGSFRCIEEDRPVWEVKELFETGDADLVLVLQGEKPVGVITQRLIEIEIGRHTDLLTGLYKSEYIIYHSHKLLEQGREISIVFFDINNFGVIDKEYGHAVGDIILKEFARVLDNNAPAGTYLCRYGGDEFVLLCPMYSEECESLVLDILKKVKQYPFHGGINISVAAGIAGGRRRKPRKGNHYQTVTNLINLASLASTRAKKVKDHLVIAYDGVTDMIAI